MRTVQRGDTVRIHYTTKAQDGSVVETSLNREPLEFVAGSPEIVEGLSQAVLGMLAGERKRVTVPPERAFGRRENALQQWAAAEMLPERCREGDQLTWTSGRDRIDVWVQRRTETGAQLDANHPLAGETLVYEIEILAVTPAAT